MDFKPFSKKQLQVLCWWTENSPHNKKDGIICDGAVNELIKSVKESEFDVELSSSQIKTLIDYIDTLSDTVESANEYLRYQKKMMIKSLCDSRDERLADLINTAFGRMSTGELLKFYNEAVKAGDDTSTQLKKPCSQKASSELEGFIV